MPSFMSSAAATGALRVDSNSAGSTAPVLEFVCLFTHDLKRKQKRWQDGRVKYHTFNKRIMVYDERGNFVGDMHWRRDWEFNEGEEVQLERGGVIVQVAECVGRQEQDLSQLLDKRAKEKEQRAASRPLVPRNPYKASSLPPRAPPPQEHFQTRHRPLHQVFGTPTGHHGRALVPNESPFEQRHREIDSPLDQGDSRPNKRRRHVTPPRKMGYAQSLFGAPLTLSAVPMSSAPSRRPPTVRRDSRNETLLPQETDSVTCLQDASKTVANSLHMPSTREGGGGAAVSVPETRMETSQDTLPSGGQLEGIRSSATTSPTDQGSCTRTTSGRGTSSHVDDVRARSAKVQLQKSPLTKNARRRSVESLAEDRAEVHLTRSSSALDTSGPERVLIIVDDGGTEDNIPGPVDEVTLGGASSKTTVRSEQDAPGAQKKQTSRRKKTPPPRCMSPLAESTPNASVRRVAAENPTDRKGQRTELRIKPRQKRGLLVASEFPKKSKRPKTQKATAQLVQKDSPGPSPNANALEPEECHQYLREDPGPHFDDDDGDPFASPFVSEGTLTRRGRPAESYPQRHGAYQEAGNLPENTVSASIHSAEVSTAQTRRTTANQTKPAHTTYNAPENSEDELIDRFPHVPTSEGLSHHEPAQISRDCLASDSASSDHDYFARSRNKLMAHTRSTHASKKESAPEKRRRAGGRCEGTDDELPKVPVGPRLARLSRRGVRSKEIIGFVISSSPVAERANTPDLGQECLAAGEFDAAPGDSCSVWVTGRGREPAVRADIEATEPTEMQAPNLASQNRQAPTIFVSDDAYPPRGRTSLPGARCQEPAADHRGKSSTPTPAIADKRPRLAGLVRNQSAVIATGNGSVEDVLASPAPAAPPNLIQTEGQLPDGSPAMAAKMDERRASEMSDAQLLSYKDNRASGHPSSPADTGCSPGRGRQPAAGAPTDNAALEVTTGALKRDRPRIANPATKGRKAALKSDAAGQVPQSILPPAEPVLAMLNMRSVPETRKDSNGNARKKMTFPGFMSARGGGPWSREAHDLLETGRPG